MLTGVAVTNAKTFTHNAEIQKRTKIMNPQLNRWKRTTLALLMAIGTQLAACGQSDNSANASDGTPAGGKADGVQQDAEAELEAHLQRVFDPSVTFEEANSMLANDPVLAELIERLESSHVKPLVDGSPESNAAVGR